MSHARKVQEECSAIARARIQRRKHQRGGVSRREAARLRALSEAYAPKRRLSAQEKQAITVTAIDRAIRWRAAHGR